jgi:hypothetical protein
VEGGGDGMLHWGGPAACGTDGWVLGTLSACSGEASKGATYPFCLWGGIHICQPASEGTLVSSICLFPSRTVPAMPFLAGSMLPMPLLSMLVPCWFTD